MVPKINSAIGVIFCLGILATPWFIGGQIPFVRTSGLAVAWLTLLAFCIFPSSLGTPTKLGLCVQATLLLGIGWGFLQMFSIDGDPITQYVPATRERLCELILATSVFFAASFLFRSQTLLPWIFGAVALNGVFITFFGLAQTVSETEKLYWTYDLIHGGSPFGPFVNGNNAGGYMIMCFAAANFFLALRVYRSLHLQRNSQVLQEKSTLQKIVFNLGESFARTEPQLLYLIAALAITSAGVAASLSRGAMVALAVAILVGWGLLFKRNIAFAALSLVVIAAGIGLIFWTQQNTAIVTNLETLSEFEDASPNRIAHWKDSLEYGTAYLPLGSGLGTYNMMYSPFQDSAFKRWFKYAENQYLETLCELGIPGLILLFTVLTLGFAGCVSLIAKPDSMSRAVGLAGLICLVGQSFAAVFDFAWFIPGNMFLFATLMGIVFGQLNWSWAARHVSSNTQPKLAIRITQAMAILLLLLSGWAVYEYSAVDARQACRRFYERFDPLEDRHLVSDYERMAKYAIEIRPDDALAHYQWALNQILQYRIAASDAMVVDVIRAQQEQIQNAPPNSENNTISPFMEQPEFTFSDAWQRSTLTSLHRLARASLNEDRTYLVQLENSKPVQDHLVPAWEALNQSRALCDKFWFIDIALAQLSLLMGHPELEETYVAQAIEKSLGNSKMLYIGGILRNQSGNSQSAFDAWNQCLRQTREFEVPIIQFCRNEVGIREFFDQVLPSEPYFRLRIAKKFFGSDADLLVMKLLLSHTKLKLDQHELPDAERNFVLGEIERLSRNYPVAIAFYNRALELDKHQVKWRMQLAKALISAGMFERAMTELNLCELYHGDHQLNCQRLLRQVKKLRIQKIKESNALEIS